MAGHRGPAGSHVGVGQPRDQEGAARGRAGDARERGREIHGKPGPQVLRHGHGYGPLDHVVEGETRSERVGVEDEAGLGSSGEISAGLLRRERRRGQEQDRNPHGGRLKMIVMPFVTEMIDGRPAVSGPRWRMVVAVPDAVPPACATTSPDRKSTRLNSSHLVISYAVFCLKKKKTKRDQQEPTRRGIPQTTTCE